MLSPISLPALLLLLTPALLTHALPSGYSNVASSSTEPKPPPQCYVQSAQQRAPLTSCLAALSLFPNTTLTKTTHSPTTDDTTTTLGNDSTVFTSQRDRYPHHDGLPRVNLPLSKVSGNCNVTLSLTEEDKGVMASWQTVKNQTEADIRGCKLAYSKGVFTTGGVFNVTGSAAAATEKTPGLLKVQVQLFEPTTSEGKPAAP